MTSSYITGSEVIVSVKQSHNAIAHYQPSVTRNLKMTNSRPAFGISELLQYLGWRRKKTSKPSVTNVAIIMFGKILRPTSPFLNQNFV